MTTDTISHELEDICFGDKRVDERAKKIIESLYAGIGSGLSTSCAGKAELKAAYRFFDNNLVDTSKILNPHYKATIERIKHHKIVALVQDTTDVDMKHMKTVENLGVLNDTTRAGCTLHPVIAFTPDKLCLGAIHTRFITRNAEDLGEKKHNNSRKIEEKESYRWIEGYRAACHIAEECPNTLCVSIGDRESDIFELLLEAKKEGNKAYLIARAWHDRKIETPRSDENQKLFDESAKLIEENKMLLEENKKITKNTKISDLVGDKRSTFYKNKEKILNNNAKVKVSSKIVSEDENITNSFIYQLKKGKVIGRSEFIIPGGRGRESRLVKQNIRATTVTLIPSAHKKNLPSISVNAVLLEEIEVPDNETPVCWMLLTTLPIDTFDNVQLIVKLYLSRWGIELFFKVLKSGCGIEELRFREASRLLPCVALYMIVAWRILFITFIGRACPDLSCSTFFEIDEWQSAYAFVMKAKPPEEPPNLGVFMSVVAILGGYQAREKQGPAGMTVIWRGIQKVYTLSEGWAAYRSYG